MRVLLAFWPFRGRLARSYFGLSNIQFVRVISVPFGGFVI